MSRDMSRPIAVGPPAADALDESGMGRLNVMSLAGHWNAERGAGAWDLSNRL
jgi:hypothetical protein